MMFRKCLALAVILLFIGMCVVPSTAVKELKEKSFPISFDGNTLYVGGSGPGNYTHIQDAVDDAVDGDTVFVYDEGSPYFENIIIDKSISLIGEDRNTTIIDGSETGLVVSITSNRVTIQGFSIQHGVRGINLRGNFTQITCNIITNNELRGISLKGLSHDNLISKNIITYNGVGIDEYKKDIPLTNPENNTISDNIINYNHNGLILMWNWGNLVTRNTIAHNEYDGIEIYLRGENIITNNLIESNRKGIWVFDTNNNLIHENTLINNSEGIDVIASERNIITYNTISNNGEGLPLDTSYNNIISNNTITNNLGNGLYLTGTQDNQIINNTISNNNIGIHISYLSFNNYFSENSLHNDGFFIVSYPNEYANNLINSKSFLYLEKQSNIVIDHNDIGQIVLLKCSSITIKNQDLSNTDIGLELWDCNNCLVSGNLISNNNDYGIYIKGNENTITRNNIENNSCGLFWWGSSNIVEKNNIISNNCDASFHLKHKCGLTTKWKNNYWGRPMILPKIILGKKDVLLPSRFGDFIITIPWIGLDKLPAKIKKNIGG